MEEVEVKQSLSSISESIKIIASSILWLKWLCMGILATGWFLVLRDFIFDL